MKIAIITSRYPSEGNPYNHMFVHMRSKEFIKQGVNVDIFVPDNKRNEYSFEGVKVREIPSKQIVKYLKDYDVLYLHLLQLYPLMKTDGWPIYKVIMQKKYPFAIYIHGSEALSFKDRFFGKGFNKGDLVTFLRKDLYHMPRLKSFFCAIKGLSGVVITPSNWIKNQISNVILTTNSCVIPNGIDVDLFSFKKVAMGGKLVSIRPLGDKVYDIESTIDVMSLLPNKYTLDIYGKGKYRKDYERLIIEKGLSKRVRIIDKFIDRNKMNKLFHKYNTFISTTKLDTQGVTMLEAMASGLLVASIENSSKKEFISDMKTGVLGSNSLELANKILKASTDEDLFRSITNSGRKSMEKIDVKLTCKKELEILKEIANNK